MDWGIVGIVLFGAVVGIYLLVKAGERNRDRRSVHSGIGMILGILLIATSIIAATWASRFGSIGEPALLEKDGTYEIRIVDFSEKDWVGVLVLKEEGKTDLIPPSYRKVSTSFFGKTDVASLRLGEIRTIQIRSLPSRREAVLK